MNPFDEQLPPESEAVFSGPDLTEEMRLGQACAQLIESDSYKLATAALQAAIWDGFKVTPMRDAEGLTYLKVMQTCVADMHRLLEDGANTGRLAARQLTEMQERARHDNEASEV